MIRATTPTFVLTISGETVDLTEASAVYVTIAQGTNTITMTGDDLEVTATTVSCFLTQSQALSLADNQPAKIQVNWTYTDTDGIPKRAATKVIIIQIGEQLLKRVIE